MSVFTLDVYDDVAIITMDDASSPQNVLNQRIQDEFESVFSQVEKDATLTGLVFISGKPDCFVAGADINMLQQIETREQAIASSQLLHSLCQRIVDLPITTVAAIDGICLGGGLELALAFDYRIASDAKATRIGVPEVQLGLLPGGGGTQRIPRLIGLPTALDMILTGKQLDAQRAKKAGLIDSVVLPQILLKSASEMARKPKLKRRKALKDRLLNNRLVRAFVISQAHKKTMSLTKGRYPAPIRILDVIKRGMSTSLAKGLRIEAQGFADLLMSPQSKQLVNIFFATTELKKDTGVDSDANPRPVTKVGVLGAGLMGAGISYVTVDKAKTAVRLKDISPEGLAKGVAYVGRIIDKKLQRKYIKPAQRQQVMARLTGTTDYTGFANSDIVIEAVFESLELKQRMVADIEALSDDTETIFATNTSAIPIDQIAMNAKHPDRLVGMHYFSPVEKMPLLEVVSGSKTADWVTATAVELGKRQGKTVIVVNDGPGFYTTRILVPYIMEAVRFVMEGVSIEEVDAALEHFGMPVGPIKLMDEVGIDVGVHIVDTLNHAFGDRIPLIDGMDRLLDDDRAGKKNGRGFYDYSKSSEGKKVDQSIYEIMRLENPGWNEISRNQIAERVILCMLNEAAFCLGYGSKQGILRSARDGDIGAIFGLGFPPFKGGPFRYMDTLGAATVVERLGALQAEHGPRFTAAPVLLDLAKSGEKFYQ